ncbi:hypothetical protein [Reichenbachiella versicolor]|uniref:hypothetical protein n=1 Tax=Reichenbachiella versicolor TaxID=1821036 RepID=UPI000D6E7F74|nr:hypothetical protein [Reichenbachiella versicolor]
MKLIKRILLIAAVMIAIAGVASAKTQKAASEKLNVVIVEQDNGKVILGFEKKESEFVLINIYNSNRQKVYTEKVSKGTVMLKRFDMTQLPMDLYSYEVTNLIYSQDQPIALVH